jgi:hypothetical protein
MPHADLPLLEDEMLYGLDFSLLRGYSKSSDLKLVTSYSLKSG